MSAGYTLGELVARLGGELVGDPGVRISRVASLANADATAISFYRRGGDSAALADTRAAAVILAAGDREATARPRIVCADPYLYFARTSAILNPQVAAIPGVHPSAVVAANADLHPSASVGAHAMIGEAAQLEKHVRIEAGAHVGARTRIGAGTTLHPRAVVYADCVIGAGCIVHAGAVIGADGFGFAPDAGAWFKIPQIGRVLIGDDVEIGANTTIDRGALDDTVIESGVKIDNQVQIGHNCHIGAHTAIAGCVGIAGSTVIGRNCMIGGAAMFAGHLHIADRVVIGAGTLISKSIDAADTYIGVYPSDTQRRWRRNAALLRNLDRLFDRVRALEARLRER